MVSVESIKNPVLLKPLESSHRSSQFLSAFFETLPCIVQRWLEYWMVFVKVKRPIGLDLSDILSVKPSERSLKQRIVN